MRLFCYQFVTRIALSNKKNIYICLTNGKDFLSGR